MTISSSSSELCKEVKPMAIRTITWTVDDDMRVSPTRVQDAGVQGDDNATRVVFSLPAFLQEGYTLYIECINCVGEYDKTDPLPVSDGAVSTVLPLKWTQQGGEATLRLVVTETINGIEELVAHSKPECRIRFAGRAKAFAKIKTLIEGSIQAAQDRIAKMIADAKVWIDNVNGVYVGGGDMPDSAVIQIDPEGEALLLDNAMSDTSENVPKTKVVKAYVDGTTAALSTKLNAELQSVDLAAANAARIGTDAQDSADAIAQESDEYTGCFYRTVNGTTEWLNPPMMAGTEYRTVERHRGKPVYVQEFAVGAMPNATSKNYNTYVGNVDRILSASVAIQEASSGRTFAYASMDVKCYVGEDAGDWMYIVITAPGDSSGNNGFVTVKYTKTTDSAG